MFQKWCNKILYNTSFESDIHQLFRCTRTGEWLSKEATVACKETRRLGIFSTRKFELLKSCHSLTLLPPNKEKLEVSKNVQYVSVAQWAAKLQLVKLGVIFHKVWQSTSLQPFELQRHTAPFWKSPNPLYLEPSGYGCNMTFRGRNSL